MSKMDELRAMREARYAEMAKRSPQTTKPGAAKNGAAPAKRAAAKRPPVAPPLPTASADGSEPDSGPALCGHRNMSGRTCTREHGHAAKSHRYS